MIFRRGLGGFAFAILGALALLTAASPSGAATAVSACGPLSTAGDYFLTKNLTATGTCITVGSEGVSLDMKGHSITGNGTGSGISDGVGFESMAIANGKISHFNIGVDLGNSCCAVIRNVSSSNNTATGILIGICCSTLDSVTASHNTTVGIMAMQCCFTMNKVEANNNGTAGGIITTGCCTAFTSSIISSNHGVGVTATDGDNFLIASTVEKNVGDGTDMSGGGNFVINSKVAENMGIGLSLIGDNNLVTGTDSGRNSSDGIFLRSAGNQITNSQASANGGFGANVGCPGSITGLNAKGNSRGSLNTSGVTCTQLNNKL